VGVIGFVVFYAVLVGLILVAEAYPLPSLVVFLGGALICAAVTGWQEVKGSSIWTRFANAAQSVGYIALAIAVIGAVTIASGWLGVTGDCTRLRPDLC
jgi:hypothetical protein